MAGFDLKKVDLEKKKSGGGNSVSFINREITLFPYNFTDKQKEAFYLELSIMISAGVDIRASLELIEKELKNEKTREVVKKIKEDVVQGSSLSEAFKSSGHFTTYEFFSIQIGEETGRLPQVLKELTAYYTNKLKQRRQFYSALSYPIVILFTSIGAVAFMLSFIVPDKMLPSVYR